jgi:hypothetical protein
MEQTQQQQQFQCTGDCMKCHQVQRQYCAAQRSYECLLMMKHQEEQLHALQGDVERILEKVLAIQDSEAYVFDPNVDSVPCGLAASKDTAQEEDGAENRSSHK